MGGSGGGGGGGAGAAGGKAAASLEELRRSADSAAASPLMSACVLAASHAAVNLIPTAALPAQAAISMIHHAPLLADLEHATRWQRSFQSDLGNLRDFVIEAAPSLLPSLLELRHGEIVRLEQGTLADYTRAVGELDPTRAVAIALFLCSQARGGAQPLGGAHAPLDSMRHALKTALTEHSSDEAIRFTLLCLDSLPLGAPPSLLALLATLFLSPMKLAVPGACRALAAAAEGRQIPLLHEIGSLLGETDLLLTHRVPVAVPAAPAASAEPIGTGQQGSALHRPPPGPNGALPACSPAEQTVSSVAGLVGRQPPSLTDLTTGTALGVGSSAPSEPGMADELPATADDEPSCAEVCTRIARKFGCGIDAGLDDAGREALAQLRGVTTRSIQRLAAELYGGNAHFLLEIVQNADDNRYRAGVVPELRIHIPTDGLQIAFDNNEVGFSARNVLALCSMGESTKSAADPHFIGNKGARTCGPDLTAWPRSRPVLPTALRPLA